jgi:hypothetical protein
MHTTLFMKQHAYQSTYQTHVQLDLRFHLNIFQKWTCEVVPVPLLVPPLLAFQKNKPLPALHALGLRIAFGVTLREMIAIVSTDQSYDSQEWYIRVMVHLAVVYKIQYTS